MPQISIGDDVKLQNGVVYAVRSVTANTTITSTTGPNSGHDYLLLVDSSSIAITVTLPSDSSRETGRSYYIADNGNAATNTITVNGNGKNISGSTTYTITQDYNTITVVYDGTNWMII